MGTISFGGLATGLDTNSMISQLMDLERQPLANLEKQKSYYSSRLNAFSGFDTKLKALAEKAAAIDTGDAVKSYSATAASSDYFSVTGSSTAEPGSYQVEVVSLAQVEKDVSQGYADKSAADFGTGDLSLQVNGGSAVAITIDSSNNSLEGIAAAINDADAGVSATIINDGTDTPYRLVLTGDAVPDGADGATQSISLDTSGLSGGTATAPSFTVAQYAQQSHIKVDTIDIYGKENSFTEAIPGVTLDLAKTNASGESTLVTVAQDRDATKTKIQEFVSAYNAVFSFVDAQSSADWGRDASFRSAKRKLQDLLVTSVDGAGSYTSLAQLGIETDKKTGQLTIDSTQLDDALSTDMDGVAKLLAGWDNGDGTTTTGIAQQFSDYLDQMTDSTDGLYASKKEATDSTLKSLDGSIERMTARLDQREKTMRAKFNALEQLVSGLNAQSSYLTQSLASAPKIGG